MNLRSYAKRKRPPGTKVPHRRRSRKEWPPEEEDDQEEEDEEEMEVEVEVEDGESRRRKEDENRGTGPRRVPRKIREKLSSSGTLTSWYSNTRMVGSMHRKKVKQ